MTVSTKSLQVCSYGFSAQLLGRTASALLGEGPRLGPRLASKGRWRHGCSWAAARQCVGAAAHLPALEKRTRYSYYVLHKPGNVSSQRLDPSGTRSVYDVFDELVASGALPGERPPPHGSAVGRLDKATTGVLLLTDDRELNGRLCQAHFEKVYSLTVRGHLRGEDERVALLEEPYRYSRFGTNGGEEVWTERAVAMRIVRFWREPVHPRAPPELGDRTEVEVTITQGKHHQVRRLAARSGLRLLHLQRRRFGPVSLGDLAEGAVRPATAEEEFELLRLCDLPLGRQPDLAADLAAAARRRGRSAASRRAASRAASRAT